MNEATLFNNDLTKEYIDKIEDLSSSEVARVRVYLKNRYSLSIIKKCMAHSADKRLFEIAPIDKSGYPNGKLLNFEYADVEGYLTEEQVIKRIIQLAKK